MRSDKVQIEANELIKRMYRTFCYIKFVSGGEPAKESVKMWDACCIAYSHIDFLLNSKALLPEEYQYYRDLRFEIDKIKESYEKKNN